MSKIKIIVTHPTGNRFVGSLIQAFNRAKILYKFNTTIAINPDSKTLKLFPAGIRKELLRRMYPVPFEIINGRPRLEFLRHLFLSINFRRATKHEVGFASVDGVYSDLDRSVAKRLRKNLEKQEINGVYSYEDGALETFTVAKKRNVMCIYDLPIGYWKAARILLKVEQERWPEWSSTIIGFNDSKRKLDKKDGELRLANKIFVASTFTKNTLREYDGVLPDIEVIPYGFPSVISNREYVPLEGRALKLIFVGSLSQRKGIADLFEVGKNLGDKVELTVIGKKTGADCAALDEALKLVNWIPSLPHDEILNAMREHDVLVFPSLFEGFGMVITEAMSQGTPVITTDRTAGPDLISHGLDGWVIQAGSTLILQDQIEQLLENPNLVMLAGKEAMITAKKRPWDLYGEEITSAVIKDIETFKNNTESHG